MKRIYTKRLIVKKTRNIIWIKTKKPKNADTKILWIPRRLLSSIFYSNLRKIKYEIPKLNKTAKILLFKRAQKRFFH